MKRCLAAAFALVTVLANARDRLPVFLADNHAETFCWVAETVDLDRPHTLVLVDAHSDASAVERSEELRDQLRRVASVEERAARVEKWRVEGRVQAFNWIEPLMPRPFDQVIWAGRSNDALSLTEARAAVDGRLEVEPRSSESLADRWTGMDIEELAVWDPGERLVVLAVDLDAFAGLSEVERERQFERIWVAAMRWEGLRGVAFAVSRPWLTDDAEADALVRMACEAVARTSGAMLTMDLAVDDRLDGSRLAMELGIDRMPRWDAAGASPALRARMVMERERWKFRDRERDWETVLDKWRSELGGICIEASGYEMDVDGVWRCELGKAPDLRVVAPGGRVRWYRLDAAEDAYDMWPETRLGKGFAKRPGRWIYERKMRIAEVDDGTLPAELWVSAGPGRVRLSAEVETESGWLPTHEIELRVAEEGGFRGTLSECFGMPYVFGIAGVREGDLSGVETGWGADCSNLLIHAWRRNGHALSWGDPGKLREQLETLGERFSPGDVIQITSRQIENGLMVDFGNHVAAVWKDREPTGILDGEDLVVHHLGGRPEILPLKELCRTRGGFALRVPPGGAGCRIRIAGDVVLAGDPTPVVADFHSDGTDLFLINLEGIPSLLEPDNSRRYDFRFAPDRLSLLLKAGVGGVSLANNHAGDAGAVGLLQGLEALNRAGIQSFGAGKNEAEACRPWRTDAKGVSLAIFGICVVKCLAAGPESAGVASLPVHADLIERELKIARDEGRVVILLIHAGTEYSTKVNDDQRHWALWLTSRGARVVAGSHPHVVQREDWHGGAWIGYSLGNALYPQALRGADSGVAMTFELSETGALRRLTANPPAGQ